MDTSIHPWLENRFGQEIVLIAMIDDATSQLRARFFPRDTGAANRQMIVDYVREHGRPGALYTDQASHFKVNWRAKERAENDEPEALTLIRRALDALEIELILALSPQAKGRVERLFGTLQDRLVKELRVAGITTMEAANRFWTTCSCRSGRNASRCSPVRPATPCGRCRKASTCRRPSPKPTNG
jgi:hypothetical protein